MNKRTGLSAIDRTACKFCDNIKKSLNGIIGVKLKKKNEYFFGLPSHLCLEEVGFLNRKISIYIIYY